MIKVLWGILLIGVSQAQATECTNFSGNYIGRAPITQKEYTAVIAQKACESVRFDHSLYKSPITFFPDGKPREHLGQDERIKFIRSYFRQKALIVEFLTETKNTVLTVSHRLTAERNLESAVKYSSEKPEMKPSLQISQRVKTLPVKAKKPTS